MTKRIVKLAYDLNGNHVPYDSEDVNFRLRIKGNSFSGEGRGLPQIHYFSRGYNFVRYLPQPLATQIEADLRANDIHPVAMVFLGMPEDVARNYVKMMEWVNKGLPPASSGAYLSTRMNW